MRSFSAFLLALPAAGLLAPAVRADNSQFQGADPHAIVIDNELWIFPTGGPDGTWKADRFGAFSSSNLKAWRSRGTLIKRDEIGWIGDDGAREHFLWAPAVATRAGKWYLYYSVGPQHPTPSRIGVAVADRPEGPYRDSGRPLIGKAEEDTTPFEAIDPMIFTDPKSDRTYLYAGGSAGARLRIWELAPDMISIRREVRVQQPRSFTEGAFMHERNGTYYLSYSHGHWNAGDYSVHYSTASSPIGPWHYRGRILSSDARHQGPGHHSFVQSPSGEWMVVYHRWDQQAGPAPFEGERQIAIDRVRYERDGSIAGIVMTDGAASPVWPGH